jgi:hypothetical protein
MRPPIRFSYTPAGHFGNLGAVRAHAQDNAGNWNPVGSITFHGPAAWADIDETAGTMVSTALPRITAASVERPYQRMGIGSELHRIASREIGPGFVLAHSGALSRAGYAFAKATGGHIPKSARPTDREHGDFYASLVAADAREIAEEGAQSGRTRFVEGSPAPPPKERRRRQRKPEQLTLDLDL